MPPSIRKKKEKDPALVWEPRILHAAFATGVLATLLFLIAYSSEYWVLVSLKETQQRADERGEFLKTGHYHGLWRICREEQWYINKTASNNTYNC